ncbi:carbohydrate porin [Roseomonas sp. E05]|uniref:carbohydrate porin n=1 Tax=Roseomonas sp. E05 TaxID=3046310 RepID=UPI0024B87C27|nr:carbohydrate porin [Roseomonas sp. E05]MDJ0388999.1 carbohydrate porin [Roseomonas sp. E05]
MKHGDLPPRAPRGRTLALLAALSALLLPPPARAQETPEPEEACETGSVLTPGLCLSTGFIVDAFGNLRGGLRRDVSAVGQLRLGLEADLGRIAGLGGWSLGASAIGIYGKQPGAGLTGSLAPPSNIEALSTVRLMELWVQREVEGWGSLRVGQLAADTEFAVADTAANLVNGTFGWPVALGEGLPSGGIAYPFAAPGVRLALGEPEEASGFRLGLFSGDPGGRYGQDTEGQRHNRYGVNFSTADGAFLIGEAVFGARAPEEGPRPWVAKLGAWYHSGGFDSPRYDADGRSLADPASSGEPRRFHNNYGGYGIGEATLWRGEGQSLAAFARLFAAPSDRNLVSLQVDGGFAWAGPFGLRQDTLSFGASQARIGRGGRGLDEDTQAFSDPLRPVRRHETVLEVNYDLPVGPVHLRPLAQWYIHPAAGEPDEETGRKLRDAVLLGMRVQAEF